MQVPRNVWLRLAAAAGVMAFMVAVTLPAEPHMRLCPYYWLTARDCPFCGLTRALFALAKGHWSEALRFNALSPLAALMGAGLVCGRVSGRIWSIGLAAFATYGILRALMPGW